MRPYLQAISGMKKPFIKTPVAGPRPGAGKMKASELKSLMGGLVSSAAQYIDEDLTPKRAEATRYYKGEKFGNEELGRSQAILTEVHDGVQAVIPGMLRTVFSDAERTVEYRARHAGTVDQAEQASDYVQYILAEENDGFLKLLAVMKDGLIRRHGILKWGWDETEATTHHKQEGLTQEQIMLLIAEKGVEPTMVTPHDPGPQQPEPDGTIAPPMFDVEFTRTGPDGKPWVLEVPPDELLANREARSLDDFLILAHRMRKTRGELLELGVTEKEIEEHGGDDPQARDNELAQTRDEIGFTAGEDSDGGEANERHLYVESYVRIDYDGDGIAELRKVCTLGPNHEPIMNEPASGVPFAIWCPDPEPHTLLGGRSWADRLMDLQRLNSSLFRSLLDSAAATVFPRTWYKEGDANLADILNTAIGAPIRTRSGPNAVGEFAHTFMGKELMPVMQMVEDIKERRTGQSKGAQGLDASALQSSTKAAVAAAVSASQAQQEMLVRIFAEGLLKPLFRGLLKLLVEHQPRAKMVRLRGKWVEVDPRTWDADMDVQVNVTLGSGLAEEKVATLMEISVKQEAYLMQLGPNNPICNYKHLRDTLAEIAALRGRKDGARYFKEITNEQMQQAEEAAKQAPPPPDPEMVKVQGQMQLEQAKAQAQMQLKQMEVQAKAQSDQMMLQAKMQAEQMAAQITAELEQMKAQTTARLEQAKAEIEVQRETAEAELAMRLEEMKITFEREKILLEDDRERDSKAADIQLKILEMELTHDADLSEQEVTVQIERERMASQAAGSSEKVASSERIAQAKNSSTEKVSEARAKTVKKAPPKSKAKHVTVERDAQGRASGYVIAEVEEKK